MTCYASGVCYDYNDVRGCRSSISREIVTVGFDYNIIIIIFAFSAYKSQPSLPHKHTVYLCTLFGRLIPVITMIIQSP